MRGEESEQARIHSPALSLSLSLAPSLSSLSLSFSPSFFGGEASACKLSLLEFSPSFAVWGGRLLIARGGNQGAFSRHQGQGARAQGPEHNNQLYSLFATFLFYFNIHYQSTSSNMDTDPSITTPGTGNNTEEALVESSPIGA